MISDLRCLVCFLLCFGASTVLASLPDVCPSGWAASEGRCWRYESNAMNYDEAVAACRAHDADDNTLRVADPRDDNENEMVLDFCKDNTALWSSPWNVWDDKNDVSLSTSGKNRVLEPGMVWRDPSKTESESPRPKYACACTPPDSDSGFPNWCMRVPTPVPAIRIGTQFSLTSFNKCLAARSSSGSNMYNCPSSAPSAYVLCKAPATPRPGVVNGRGSCWLGGMRTNQQTTIAWQVPRPQVSTTVSWDKFEANLRVLSSSSDQAQFLKISHAGYGGNSATPNCIAMWNYRGNGSWILDWCNKNLPHVCVRDAKCPGGYRKSQSYAVTSGGSIQKGQCTPCTAGTYRAASDDESFCKACDPGFYGTGTTSQCTNFCPAGSYCPSGSPNPIYCSQGYYGLLLPGSRASVGPGWPTQEEACALCPAGSYCDQAGLLLAQLNNRKCLAGTCGDPGATTSSCSRSCPQGYYCPLGSACPGLNCGSPSVYCPAGSTTPWTIPDGYYGIGASNVRWEGILPCSPGFYCTGGVRIGCPLGTYSNAEIPVAERGQCKPCKSGYFCPGPASPTSAGSTSATQEFCSDINGPNPAAKYCLNGVRYELDENNRDMMTIPVDGPLNARENVVACPSNKACLAGLANDLVEWVNCSSGHQTVEIPELLEVPNSDAAIEAKLFQTLEENEDDWSLKYYLLDQKFFDLNLLADQSIDPACKAGSTLNDGIFEIDENTGRIKVNRYAPDPTDPSAALQYEVCEPIVNVRYSLIVRASAKQLVGGSTVANITCNVNLVVLNRNDQPIFSAPVHNRVIEESAKENTPAARCHGVEEMTGCPDDDDPTGDNEIGATDEDDFNQGNLVYEFVGELTEAQLKLKINSCTGLISQKGGAENVLRFSDETIPTYNSEFKRLNYTVRVTDDGNSGKFAPRSSETLVFVYIRNVNDRPVIMTQPDTYFWVAESTAAKRYPVQREVTPNTLAVYDDDPDDIVTLTLVQNDGGAFEIVGGIIRTTLQGENFIDYESTKKSYTIGIEARDNGSPPYATPITITIYVANLNDPPIIESSLIFYIAENAQAGDPVCRDTSGKCTVPNPMHAIKSTDPDNIPTDKTHYSLTQNPGGLFAIHEEEGQITLVASGTLNFENEALNMPGGTGRGYNMTVTATSDGVGVVTQPELETFEEKAVRNFVIYIVDVNEAPEFTTSNETSFRVVETSPVGVALNYIEILAIDKDNDDQFLFNTIAPRDTLSFGISDTPADTADGSAFFSVSTHPTNNSRARITVKAPLNYEVAPDCGDGVRCYKLRIRVTDNSGGYSERVYQFDLVDVNEIPSFTQSTYTISVPENLDYFSKIDLESPVPLIATDPDIGGNELLTYTITLKDSFGEFALESLGAGAGFKLVKAVNQFVNYEFKNKYTLRVMAKDNRPGSSAIGKACTIDQGISFGCGDGAFCQNQQCYEICPIYGNGVVNISSSEVPRVDIFFCDDLSGVDGHEPLTDLFYETTETTITIQVTNSNDPPFIVYDQDRPQPTVEDNLDCSLNGVVTLGLIDEKDQFPFSSIQVWDDDTPNPGPMAGPFKFTETGGDFWDHFNIVNDATGRIMFPECSEGPTCASYFEGQIFNGTIDVADSAGLGSTCELVVTILDQNIPPDFQYDVITAEVEENTNTADGLILFEGYNLTELVKIDSDITNVNNPDNLTFSSTFSLQYTIDRYNSRITLKQPLNYEALYPTFSLKILVRVVDKRGADDVMEVTIPVKDVNEAPVWEVQSLQYQVDEDAEGGTVISDLNSLVSDPDEYPADESWATTTISIAPGTGCGEDCPVEVVDGVLQLKSDVNLDFETLPNSWSFALRVTDGAGLFTEIGATVSLKNVNEAPVFTATTSVAVQEGNGGAGGRDLLAMSLFVNDPDASDPISSLTFEVLSGDEGVFEISPSGMLRVAPNAELDYEDVRSYILTVKVSDPQGKFSEGSFTVLVENVHDVTVSSITVKSGPNAASGQLACDGTTSKIEIVGTNLGFKDHDDNPATFEVTYRRPVVSGPPAQMFSATNCVAVISNTHVECDVNMGGAGMNLIWDISVTVPDSEIDGDAAMNIPTTISFPPPSISQVLGTTNMKTSGGETITIEGTCLGTSQDGIAFGQATTDSFVQLCTTYDSVCRPLLSGCTVNSATGVSILCTNATIPGLGATISFSVRIAGQDSNLKTSGGYGRPSVTGLSLTTLRTSGQILAPGLRVNGTNFGGLGAVPSRAQLFYDNFGTIIRYNLIGCTVTIAYTQVTCTSHQAGVGKDIWLEIEFGLQYNPSSPLLVFEAPVVTTVATDGGALSPTDGGLLVTLTGTSFGPVCGVPGTSVADGAENCPWVSATYTRHSLNIHDEEIIYEPTYCAVISSTQVVCTMVEGTGRGHEWTLTVGQQAAFINPNAGTTGYSSPVVGAYDGPGSKDALTSGNQYIDLKGGHFGPIGGAKVTAVYGNDLNPTEFTAVDCLVIVAHSTMRCFTGVGAGDALAWKVTVDGQESRAQLSDYGPPIITQVRFNGAAATNLRDDGGQVLTLNGNNFGPPFTTAYLESVTYGPASFQSLFTVTPYCTVVSHEKIECTTVPSLGQNLRWRVVVRGQASEITASAVSSVRLPSLDAISATTGKTNGGNIISVTASSIGVCVPNVQLRVLFGDTPVEVREIYREDSVDPINVATECNPGLPLSYGPERILTFAVPEMTGTDTKSVRVRVDSTAFSGGYYLTPQVLTYKYGPPNITDVFAEPGPIVGTILVTLSGINFCRSEACCQTYLDGELHSSQVTVHTHERISFLADQPGTAFVRCPGGDTLPQEFNSQNPFIYGVVRASDFRRIDDVTFPTVGGDKIYVFSLYATSSSIVTIGGRVAENTVVETFPCDTTAEGYRPDTISGIQSILVPGQICARMQVDVPPGQGRLNDVVVTVGALKSRVDDARFEYLSYIAPVITGLSASFGQSHPTLGSTTVLTVTGTNFGLNGEILFGPTTFHSSRNKIWCGSGSPGFTWSHTTITCQVPPGEGSSLDVRVMVGGQLSPAALSGKLKYQTPTIFSFKVQDTTDNLAKTIGGQTLVINGTNFGRFYNASAIATSPGQLPTVMVGSSLLCAVLTSDHSEIKCTIPPSDGKGIDLKVMVAGEAPGALSPVKFAYGPPVVYSISPSVGRTSGKDDFGNRQVLQLIGENFGVDTLRVEFGTKSGPIVLGVRSDRDGRDDFLYPGTNHTSIRIYLPSYFGADLNVTVTVNGQKSNPDGPKFSYLAPVINTANITQPRSLAVEDVFVDNRDWTTNSAFGQCRLLRPGNASDGSAASRKAFKTSIEITSGGTYTRRFRFFSVPNYTEITDDTCSESAGGFLGETTQSGTFTDLGELPSMSCLRLYRDTVTTVVGYAMDAQLRPSGGFGFYVVSEMKDLFLSLPSFDTLEDTIAAPERADFSLDDDRTATLLNPIPQNFPLMLTSGCIKWESEINYRTRVQNEFLNPGASVPPRKCLDPARIEVIGENFGSGENAPQGALRVYLVDDRGVEYEASTTSSGGNHELVCTNEMGCVHEDTRIIFQVPFGSGRGLKVRIVLDNQNTTSAPMLDYYGPEIQEIGPGTIAEGWQFMSTTGQEVIQVLGQNLGYLSSDLSVMFNGKPCTNATWVTGFAESEGRSSIQCVAPVDVPGIKSVFVCVGGQGKMSIPINPSDDVAALQYGIQTGTWNTTGIPPASSAATVRALAVSRCPPGMYGRIGEICLPCPIGGRCYPGFGEPVPEATFSLINMLPTSPRALEGSCKKERIDRSMVLEYPEMVFYETCSQMVRCVPEEACLDRGVCAEGYEYQLYRCRNIRNDNKTDNSCRVFFDAALGVYRGVNEDCQKNTAPGQTCSFENPEDCSECQVIFDSPDPDSVRGECTCVQPPRCALCTATTHYRLNNECVKCPDNPALVFSLFILAGVGCIALAYYLQKRKINLAFLSVGVDYFQVLAVLATTNVPWPPFIRAIFTIFSLFLASIDIAAPECLVPNLEFTTKFYLTELLPAVALSILLSIHIGYTIYKVYKLGKQAKYLSHVSRLIGIYVLIVYVLYLSLTKKALDVFNCNPLDPDDGYSYTAFSSLSCDGGGLCRCYEAGGLQESLIAPAVVFLVVYTFGFPCLVAYVIFSHRENIREDQYLRANRLGERRETNPRAYDTRKRFQLMYMHFKPKYSFWMLSILARKFGVAFASLMFRGNPSFQLAVILVVLFISFTLQVSLRPYMSPGEFPVVVKELNDNSKKADEDPEQFAIYRDLFRKVQESMRVQAELIRKEKMVRHKMGAGFWEESKQAAREHDRRSVAEKYFFDLNAVEAVLLGATIIIALAGIMFESGRFATRSDIVWQADLVVVLVFIVLFGSLAYYVLVFINELWPVTFARYCGRCFLRYQNDGISNEELDRMKDNDIVLDANPLFAASGPVGDKSKSLQKEIEASREALSLAKRQNEELKRLKAELEGGGAITAANPLAIRELMRTGNSGQ